MQKGARGCTRCRRLKEGVKGSKKVKKRVVGRFYRVLKRVKGCQRVHKEC